MMRETRTLWESSLMRSSLTVWMPQEWPGPEWLEIRLTSSMASANSLY
jgi:hypothetical protein